MPRYRRSSGRGFTLVELLVTLAIVAILAGLAAPSYRDALRRQQLRAAAGDFLALLVMARSEALARGMPILVLPAGASGWKAGWNMVLDANGNGAKDDDEKTILNHDALAASLSVNGKADAIVFNAHGRAQADSWTFQLDDRNRIKVILNLLGRPRSCDPVADMQSC